MICREMVLSVSFTGLKLGRSGSLVWVTVATSGMVFHFDVAKIGDKEVMKGGLGAVLQDGTVVKVLHDCRAIEDLLHHQLNLNLSNVYDTQVRFSEAKNIKVKWNTQAGRIKFDTGNNYDVLCFLWWNCSCFPRNV